jgi:DNA polymerase V
MKQYSVDEAFLYLPNKSITELTEYCRDIYTNIIQWTNIPVSLGIGHTKTQAKLANFVGKKLHENQSVVHFDTISDEMLQQIPVGEIWGIGRALQKRLTSYLNIHTVYDFMRKDKIWIKNTLKSHGLAPYLELHGVPCTKERKQNFPKSIISSRSFGQPIESKADLKHAIASFVHTACYKLHKSKSRCQYINLYITSNRFRTDQQQYKNSMGISLPAPTNSIPELLNYADLLLDQIYKPGILYKKARILLAEITSEEHLQTDLFKKTSHEQDVLMDVYNTLNKKHGKNTVYFAAQGIAPKWRPRNAHQSPAYTTRWSDLPIVKAN